MRLLFISLGLTEKCGVSPNIIRHGEARTDSWVFRSFSATFNISRAPTVPRHWVGTAARVVITVRVHAQLRSQASTPSTHKWSVWDRSGDCSHSRSAFFFLFHLDSRYGFPPHKDPRGQDLILSCFNIWNLHKTEQLLPSVRLRLLFSFEF